MFFFVVGRLDHWVRQSVPVGITMLFILLSLLPFGSTILQEVMPCFGLMAVFYWTIHRPDLLHPLTVFILGLLQDAFTGTPIGMHALIYVGTYWIVVEQRRLFLGTSFLMLWWGFALMALVAETILWMGSSLVYGHLINAGPAIGQFLATIAIFPLPAWLLIRVQRLFLPLR